MTDDARLHVLPCLLPSFSFQAWLVRARCCDLQLRLHDAHLLSCPPFQASQHASNLAIEASYARCTTQPKSPRANRCQQCTGANSFSHPKFGILSAGKFASAARRSGWHTDTSDGIAHQSMPTHPVQPTTMHAPACNHPIATTPAPTTHAPCVIGPQHGARSWNQHRFRRRVAWLCLAARLLACSPAKSNASAKHRARTILSSRSAQISSSTRWLLLLITSRTVLVSRYDFTTPSIISITNVRSRRRKAWRDVPTSPPPAAAVCLPCSLPASATDTRQCARSRGDSPPSFHRLHLLCLAVPCVRRFLNGPRRTACRGVSSRAKHRRRLCATN